MDWFRDVGIQAIKRIFQLDNGWSKQEEGKRVNLYVMETEWEVKYFPKNFDDALEKGRRS